MGTGIFPGVWGSSGREADRSPPSSAKAKNEWSCNSNLPHAFMEQTGTALLLLRYLNGGKKSRRRSSNGSHLGNVLLVAPQPATIRLRLPGPIAHSVMWRLRAGWSSEESCFDSRQRQGLYTFQGVEPGYDTQFNRSKKRKRISKYILQMSVGSEQGIVTKARGDQCNKPVDYIKAPVFPHYIKLSVPQTWLRRHIKLPLYLPPGVTAAPKRPLWIPKTPHIPT
jgi:hypothetical protein